MNFLTGNNNLLQLDTSLWAIQIWHPEMITVYSRLFAMVNVNWPTAVAGEADIVSSVSACHIGGPSDVNPGELALIYGIDYQIKV